MDSILENKFQDFLDHFEKKHEVEELKNLTKKIRENKNLTKKLEKLHNLNTYDREYATLKQEIMEDKDYKRYLELTSDIYYLTLSLTNLLKSITKGEQEWFELLAESIKEKD